MHPGIHAHDDPDATALIWSATGESTSWRELDERSNRLAHLFRERGLRRGDHLALIVGNEPLFFDVAWAAYRSGLYYTPISASLQPSEIDYIVHDAGASAVVASASVLTEAAAATLRSRIADVPTCLLHGREDDGWLPGDVLAQQAPSTPIDDESPGRDMLYSSGTTGRPKGVLLPLPTAPLDDAEFPISVFGRRLWHFGPGMRYLSPAPLYHGAPLRFSMAVMQQGGTVVMMERFDAASALVLLERHAITHSQWVPTMFVRLLRLDESERSAYDLTAHEVAIHAAAPCPIPVKQQMIDWWGPILYEYYSATEGHGMTAITSEEWLAHRGSVGRAVFGTPHVVDEDGSEQPVGDEGLVYFEGGNEFVYHNDPVKTSASRDPEGRGWATVGDVGYLDDEGYLYLTDRQSHMIISGGVNIYPQEIENCLSVHPAVEDVAVIGVPDEDLGEQVKAVVIPVDPATDLDALSDELLRYCREQLAHYKCPRSVDFTDSLPRKPTGKLNKHELIRRYRGDRERPAAPEGDTASP